MTVEAPAFPEAPAPGERMTLSPKQALEMAFNLQRSGHPREALALYAELEGAFEADNPLRATLDHFHGVACFQVDECERAIGLIARSLEVGCDNAGWWNNYACALRGAQRYDEAIDAFGRVEALAPDMPETYNNLGLVQRARRNLALAEQCFLRAVALRADFGPGHHNLADLYYHTGRVREAVMAGFRAATYLPALQENRRLLAYCHMELGEFEQARTIYREILAEEPDNAMALHHLDAIEGRLPERAADAYVTQIFDSFAKTFDEKLASLDYCAPDAVTGALARYAATRPAPLGCVLDAGCGTGLCGPAAKALARRLVGVDLSGPMLERAQARGGYDALEQAELTAFLQRAPQAYDAVISADTLCYFGALNAVSAAAHASLKPGGAFIFTVEALPDAAAAPFLLSHNGRFRHSQAYVRQTLQAQGFEPPCFSALDLRMEVGIPVAGYVVEARRSARD